MSIVSNSEDAFGRALLDHLGDRKQPPLTLETDAGWSTPAMPPSWFFEPPERWADWERDALEAAEGPVLDLGAGAGRAALFLQEAGLQVCAVDSSPGAIEVCRHRGVRDARLMDFLHTLPSDHEWKTVLMLCGNFGLAGDWAATRELLSRLHELCADGAVLIGDTVDPTVVSDERSKAYQQRMLDEGAYVGSVTLRLVYGEIAGPWWKQMIVLIGDAASLIARTGWKLEEHFVPGMDHYLKLRREWL